MTSHCCQKGKPRDHAHQLLNHIVDCLATRKPQALYGEYPVAPTSYQEGFAKITYSKLANAINRIAWWLVGTLGHGRDHEVLAYIGPNDLIYPALILGAIKAGYTTLLLSPRNSLAAQLHLMKATKCTTFLTPELALPPVKAVVDALDDSHRVHQLPSVSELLVPCEPFPYDVAFEDGCRTPFTIMHTSGSTGMPKPITWPQEFVPTYAKQLQLAPPPGYASTDKLYEANRIFVAFPPFHAAYIAHALVNAITNQTAIIFPLKGAIPSAQSLSDTVDHTKVDAALVVPTIIEEMSRSPELLDNIAKKVDTMVYSGGDVPQGCGDIVAARMPVINFYGSTEGASCALVYPSTGNNRKDWKYLSLHPAASVEFRHHAEDLYELFIVRRPEYEEHLQIFKSFPEETEWRTKDLFRRHPTNPNLWSHRGRADDTVVFLTGEKVNPVNMEQYIFSKHPEVSGVLVIGSQRFQAGLLVELIKREAVTDEYKEDLIEKMWPSIEYVNETCPSHARIARTHIMFVDPQRPMARSPKGTIQRAGTLAEYQSDMDAMYEAADAIDNSVPADALCDIHDTKKALQCLETLFAKQTGLALAPEDNFFLQGMDSLQALLLVREIRRTFSIPKLAVGSIYSHPSLSSLLTALQELRGGTTDSKPQVTDSGLSDISPVLSEFYQLIDKIPAPSTTSHASSTHHVFLLTGSTGFLGSYILATLLDSDAQHIYCLNRSQDSGQVQEKRNRSKALSTNFPSDRVTFLAANLSEPSLGLDPKVYANILSSVTHIIHNAWAVDFNIPLSAYQPQLKGVVNLIQLAAAAPLRPTVFYISSVSAISSLGSDRRPEQIVNDNSAPAPMGYGTGKYVAEHLLDHAANRLSLDARVARLGQIAGPLSGPGQWNRWEWLPSLIRSSLEIGALPASLGANLDQVDWIPVDQLAKVLVDLIHSEPSTAAVNGTAQTNGHLEADEKTRNRTTVFNVLNPASTQWQALLPSILRTLKCLPRHSGAPATIRQVPFAEWIQQVRDHFEAQIQAAKPGGGSEMGSVLEANPAAKLAEFYDAVRMEPARTWETARSQRWSPTLDTIGAIRGDWLDRWIQGWFPPPA